MSNRFNPDPADNDPSSFSPRSSYLRYLSSLSQYQYQNLNLNNMNNQNPCNEVRFSPQIQNPSVDNQTLEDVFSRLSVNNNNNNHQSYGYGVNGVNSVGDLPYYNYGIQVCETNGFNRPVSVGNIVNGGGEITPSPQNLFMRSDNRDGYGFNGFNNDYALLTRQSCFGGYGNGGGVVVVGGDELHGKSQFGLMNESSVQNVSWGVNDVVNVNNVNVSNVNGRNSHWFDDFRGRVYTMAKDHHGSKILQDLIDNFKGEAVSYIFPELISYMIELMPDPAGSQVIQKMVGFCNQDQQTRIVLVITHHSVQLIKICLNLHGSRAVEKLLEKITTRQQRTLIMSALTPSAILMSKDINGYRVVVHCLRSFPHDETKQFMYVLAKNTLSIARDKTGCCVLQQCASHTQGEAKDHLIDDIVRNAPLLAEDCYGNYVIQHLLSLKIARVSTNLFRQLEGQFIYLACNKYGSNVVEKFFQDSGASLSALIILELLRDPNVSRLLVDPYGNYVISSALTRFKGDHAIKSALLQLIQTNSQMMRTNMYGKKLLDKFEGRNQYL
ncbi:pumilio [Trifolium repens]|nr:pumilio [Trifolium repens]